MTSTDTGQRRPGSSIVLEHCRLVTPLTEIADATLRISDGVIEAIEQAPGTPPGSEQRKRSHTYDVEGRYVVPGFIDLHTNGGGGVEAYHEDLQPWMDFLMRTGVTGFAPTLVTRPYDEMVEAARRITRRASSESRTGPSPRILGAYPEGPFINGRYGQQPAENCLHPADFDTGKLLDAISGSKGIVTVAPELPGAYELIASLVGAGHIAAIGHSAATPEQTARAVDLGATLASHLACAVGSSRPRWPETREGKFCGAISAGAMEVLLTRDEVYAEVIVDQDGVHVDPVILELIRRCKPSDRLITISDNMASAGMPDGVYETVDGRSYRIDRSQSDLIRLEPEGTLAGVVYPVKDGVRNLMAQTPITLCDAIASATLNPARLLGIDDTTGSIEVGKHADIAVLDADWNVEMTLIHGEVAYLSDQFAR